MGNDGEKSFLSHLLGARRQKRTLARRKA
jgi:hypothetical protein